MNAEVVSIVGDVVVSISAAAVALTAFYGLRAWRRELTGRSRFQTARSVMQLAYKLKADFAWARNPVTTSGEYTDRQRRDDESKDESDVRDLWFARNKRLMPLAETVAKLQEAGWQANVIMSESSASQVSEAIQTFIKSWAELSSAVYDFFEVRIDEARSGEMYRDQDWLRGLRHVLFSSGNDSFSQQIDGAIEQLSSALKPHIR